MEKTDLNKQILLGLIFSVCIIQEGTAYSTSPASSASCVSSTANITYNLSLGATESIIGTRIWYFGTNKIAESDGTTLSPVLNYSSRLTAYGTYGISLSNVVAADNGIYRYVIILLPSGNPFTATATLSVLVAPLAPPSGCPVSASQSMNNVTCTVNTGSGNCGTPALNTYWVNIMQNTSNQFECTVGGTYQCCATSAALTCYSGSPNEFCTLFNCTPVTTPTTTTTTTTSTTNFQNWWCTCGWCIGLVVTSGGLLVLTVIVGIIIFCKKRKDIDTKKRWQISTISIAVLVVIIIVVTGVLAGVVCLCWKANK